ncbi:MAG: hypothetical protein ACREEM_17520 [Blastocatellia bacterium]
MCFRLAPTHDEIRHNLAVAYHNYGNRLMEAGKSEEALRAFHQAILAAPRSEIAEGIRKSVAAVFTNIGASPEPKQSGSTSLPAIEIEP